MGVRARRSLACACSHVESPVCRARHAVSKLIVLEIRRTVGIFPTHQEDRETERAERAHRACVRHHLHMKLPMLVLLGVATAAASEIDTAGRLIHFLWSFMTEVSDGIASQTTTALETALTNAENLIFSFLQLSEEMVATRTTQWLRTARIVE